MAILDPCAPRTSPFAPGETDSVIFQAAPCLPVSSSGTPTAATIVTSPAPTATPPAGSGITCPSVWAAANPLTGLLTDLVIQIAVSAETASGDYPIALLFSASDGVAVKPRTLVIPVRSGI